MQCGVQINIDNLSILEQFTKHPNVPVCIRINPHVMAVVTLTFCYYIDSKFGISIHQLPLWCIVKIQ
jgi:diaminopimelate decarboxylase